MIYFDLWSTPWEVIKINIGLGNGQLFKKVRYQNLFLYFTSETKKLVDLIKPYIIPTMMYKIGINITP